MSLLSFGEQSLSILLGTRYRRGAFGEPEFGLLEPARWQLWSYTPGNSILAPRVLELWLCMGDFATLSLGLFILKASLGCLGGSREQAV